MGHVPKGGGMGAVGGGRGGCGGLRPQIRMSYWRLRAAGLDGATRRVAAAALSSNCIASTVSMEALACEMYGGRLSVPTSPHSLKNIHDPAPGMY